MTDETGASKPALMRPKDCKETSEWRAADAYYTRSHHDAEKAYRILEGDWKALDNRDRLANIFIEIASHLGYKKDAEITTRLLKDTQTHEPHPHHTGTSARRIDR